MDYSNLKNEFLNQFSNLFIVDITNDKVVLVDNGQKEISFFDFVSYETPLIHPEDLKNFFDNLNITKLENSNGSLIFNYRLKNGNDYENYVNYLKLVVIEDKKLILSSSIKSLGSISNSVKDNKMDSIVSEVSDVILKIYNTIDASNEMNSTGKYIYNLLDNLTRNYPEFNKSLEKNMISQVNKTNNSIFIIDDDSMTRKLLTKCFQDEFNIVEATNGEEAINIMKEQGFDNIEGIFLDLMMPVLDGFAVLDYLKSNNILSKIPVVIISGIEDKETRKRVYQYNIADMLEKPFNLEVIKYRTKNFINLYKTSSSLNNMVFSQEKELRSIISKIVDSYKYDYKDKIDRIKKSTKIILEHFKLDYSEYGLDDYKIGKIIDSIDLYDVGLYVLPKTLGSNGTFSDEEKTLYCEHPKYGKMIVQKYLDKQGDSDLLKYSSDITYYCHENFIGTGFPSKLKEDSTPIWAQIVGVMSMVDFVLSRNDLKILQNEELISKYFSSYNIKVINTLRKLFDEIRTLY